MTTHDNVTCEVVRSQLMGFLEGDTDDETRRAVERHARRCAECGALLGDLVALRADAARLPEFAPARDLWTGIAARIEAPVVPIATALPALPDQAAQPALSGPDSSAVRRRQAWRAGRAALFAASLLAAVGLGYYAAAVRTPLDPAAAVGSGDSAAAVLASAEAADDSLLAGTVRSRPGLVAEASAAASAQLAVAMLSADYDREIARLRKLLDERRGQMDPATVTVIEKSLRVIDVAIAESRRAIAQDPASRFLIEQLNQSLETKVELLRIAAALPNRG
jgi:hypothetical protein